jgi:hypothetical protein
MKVFINRLPIEAPWGGGNKWVIAFNQFASEFGITVVHDIRAEQVDAIIVAGFDAGNSGVDFYRALNICASSKTKLIVRINENDARKGTTGVDNTMWSMINMSHGAIFVSQWLQQYYVSKFKTIPSVPAAIVYNGVNKNHFCSQPKLNNGKINILSSHWSDNHLKGQDVTEWLDCFVGKHHEDYTFTFVGRTKASLQNSKHIQPLFGVALGEELGKYDVCINGSKFDPGPNSVIEPITCGLPTYVHSDGGGAVEFAGPEHTFHNFEELENLLLNKNFTPNLAQFQSWKISIQNYVDFIKNVCGKSTA